MLKCAKQALEILEQSKKQKCPVCDGVGHVPISPTIRQIIGTSRRTWECKKCFGTGVSDAQ